ncbi:GNAT family N-acetyltransferase [Streptomyces sp. NPDC039016]|uniref:GNAT family N-acetyltransferase n=1 Tax=unclassified Streptomyces TaxID=2593676 RepID=UPI0013166F1C|nr:GNAT family N-acetyltransferase [Streptomyces sp. GS7]QHC22251.1 GNAT family N-acetyltransferase [Streptomyces sp. GS7]
MDQDTVLAVFDREMRQGIRADGPGARVERVGGVVRHVGADADGWNGVVWSELDEATADAAIAEQVEYFTWLGRGFEWKLYGYDRPADLPGRLRAAGFVPEPEETLMVAEIKDLPTSVELPEGVRLLPVTDAAGVELAVAAQERAFGEARQYHRHLLLGQLAAGLPPAVVAMAGDVPVSAARMELHPGTSFASLWGGGTVPEWRGRGVYRALVAFRTRIAAEHGYRYLQVDASDQSRPILRRLGFVPLATTTPYVHTLG